MFHFCVLAAYNIVTHCGILVLLSVSQMSIRCGSEKFKVFVNGLHFCDYAHRIKSVTEIDMLEINGDVEISYIHF